MIKIKPIDIQNKRNLFLAAFLIALFAVSMLAPLTFAQVGISQPEKTSGFIDIAPHLIGVGQYPTVNLWIFPIPTTYYYGTYYSGFYGITLTFVRPDGTKDTFMPTDGTGQFVAGETESNGAIFFNNWAPNMAGNWSVSFTMPAQNITDTRGTVQYSACISNTAYFTVQTEPVLAGLINGYPWSQLPDSNTYWSYPINSNNREWSAIAGDWLYPGLNQFGVIVSATSNYWQPYGSGPNTAHIIWNQPFVAGGIINGDYGSVSYATAEEKGVVIIEGKAFVNIQSNAGGFGGNSGYFKCIDLTTGKTLYTTNGTITCGIHVPGNAYSQSTSTNQVILGNSFGSSPIAYLFGISGTTWNFFDPNTGIVMRSIVNASAGSYKLLDDTPFVYGTASGQLYAWNMSKVVNSNWPTGITWTSPSPTSLIGSSPSLFAISTDGSTLVLRTTNQYWGYSAKDGTSLWNLTLTYSVASNEAFYLQGVQDFVVFNPVDVTFNCYSMTTGALLWTSPSFSSSPWASVWDVYSTQSNDYDNLYLMFPDGTMTALSLATGKEIWRSLPIPSTEYTNNAVPYVSGMVMVGGNIYAYAGYSPIYELNPIPRQAMLVCINATTGNVTYTLDGGVYPYAAAGGYIIGLGRYDGNLYCVGKGQTSTSVMIQNDVVANGATALIKGNVLDQSPAQPGTPAVSDASMSEQMDFLHMQNATLLNNPPKESGVPVTLTAVDPNGNALTIGSTTTDSTGNYALNFVPDKIGIYTITATFAGTNAYWPSTSETTLSVTSPVATATPVQVNSSAISEATLYTAIAALIVVVIIVGIALGLLIVRKRQ